MLRLERHVRGPRCFVLGRRVHEYQLGLALAAAALALACTRGGGALTVGLGAAGCWLVAKDWRDLFPALRDTASWRLGLHRPGPRGSPADGLPRLAGLGAALVGAVNLVSAVTPNAAWRGHVLLALGPVSEVPLFHALALQASVGLLVVSVLLARRRRRAWQLTFALLLALGAFDLLKGLDVEEALLAWGLAGVLWWGRAAFAVRHAPLRRSALPLAGVASAAALAAAVAAAVAHGAGRLGVARETAYLLLAVPGVRFDEDLAWVPASITALGAASALLAAWALFRPLRAPRELPAAELRAAAASLVRRHGSDTLDYFKLRADQRYLFSADGRAFVGYGITAGVLLVAGDPVGPDDALPGLIAELRAFAAARDLRVGALGASRRLLPLWREAGLRALYLGDEAVVRTAAFSLEGRPIRKVRQSVTRAEREGFTFALRPLAELDAAERAALDGISLRWRGGAAERGFTMAMDALRGEDSLVAVASDRDGVPQAFLHLVPTYGRPAVSLSLMRRDPETPNGLTECLVARTLLALRERGVEEVSLNFAAFGRWLTAPASRLERALGRLVSLANPFFQIESLLRFNAKFFPGWEPRYVVFERPLALPRTGLGALVLEGQVPRLRLRRAVG